MHNKILVGTWAAACSSMSIFTLLPAIKTENINMMCVLLQANLMRSFSRFQYCILCANYASDSLTGGFLMVLVGVLYILFQKSILSSTTRGKQASLDGLSGFLLGVQVGLIMLAIIVTRSSVASLQAKTGLPLGNQVVGWTILSMQTICDSLIETMLKTSQSRPCPYPSSTVFKETITISTASSSSS